VKGVYTTDPRVVEDAKLLDSITFEEMLELASLGAKVLQIRAVEFAGKYKVPLRVLSSFEDGPGTLISLEGESKMEDPTIAGIAFQRDEAKVTVAGIPDIPGLAYQVIGPVSEAGIEVDVIVQNAAADGNNDITFTVKRNESERAKKILDDLAPTLKAESVSLDKKIGKVSVVGVGMKSHAGIASKMFKALADENINIQIITTSEIKISIVIEEKYLELAVRALHAAFDLGDPDYEAGSID
jgi:aspartate kinase